MSNDTPAAPALTDAVPSIFLRNMRRAIAAAERPEGMSTHDGMASVNAGQLRWVLDALERLQRESDAAQAVLADAAAQDALLQQLTRERDEAQKEAAQALLENARHGWTQSDLMRERDEARAVCRALDEFQRDYFRNTLGDAMPGNEHYGPLLMGIVDRARQSLAGAQQGGADTTAADAAGGADAAG